MTTIPVKFVLLLRTKQDSQADLQSEDEDRLSFSAMAMEYFFALLKDVFMQITKAAKKTTQKGKQKAKGGVGGGGGGFFGLGKK